MIGVQNGCHLEKKIHALGIAAICWAIWKARNRACFEGDLIKNPVEILCHACAFTRFWAGLYAKDDKEILIKSVNAMLKITVELLTKPSKKTYAATLIQEADQDRECDHETPK